MLIPWTAPVSAVTLLDGEIPLRFEKAEGGLRVYLPQETAGACPPAPAFRLV